MTVYTTASTCVRCALAVLMGLFAALMSLAANAADEAQDFTLRYAKPAKVWSKEALPIVRYRTRDLTRLLPPTARAMRRIEKITGRSDDMMIIRGVNVFPTQIEELMLRDAAPASFQKILIIFAFHPPFGIANFLPAYHLLGENV